MSNPRVGVALLLVATSVVVTAGSAAKQQNNTYTPPTPQCQDQASLSGSYLTVVTTVSAPSDKTWLYNEAPAMVAGELLADLNALGNINYSEANGVAPNLYLTVTLNQETSGTEQDTAWADVSGLGFSGNLFHVDSGTAPYTSAADAISALAAGINSWLVTGWTTTAACIQADGSTRPAST